MKNKIVTIAITGVIATMGFSVSAQQDKKAEKARKELAGAKQDLKEAKIDSAVDFHRFKKEAELQIGENQKKIDIIVLEEIVKKFEKNWKRIG